MDQQWILIDEHTGLHVSWYFWLRVLDEVNRSTRYGSPFALLLLEAEVEAPGGKLQRQLQDAAATVPPAVRSTDLAGIIGPGQVAVLLTHQDAESAEQARDRILERMAVAGGTNGVRWLPTLLTHPQDSAEIGFLLTTGGLPDEEAPTEASASQSA